MTPEWLAEVMVACRDTAEANEHGEFRINEVFDRLDTDDILKVRNAMAVLESEGHLGLVVREAKMYWTIR